MALSHKQILFINHYMVDGNASAASLLAGYKSKPNVKGAQLLANISIKAEISKRQAELAKASEVTTASLVATAKQILDHSLQMNETGHMRSSAIALKANQQIAQLTGLLVEKNDLKVTHAVSLADALQALEMPSTAV